MADILHIPQQDLNKKAIRDGYAQAITDLENIQTSNLNTTAKLETAVKGQALIIEQLLKFIKTRLVD